jgi:glycosyltransferase involved in cell wall biosynthesis
MMITIDLVIPSYRLQEDILNKIVSLQKPSGVHLSIYLIADNPLLPVPPVLLQWQQEGKISLVVNETNLGFSAARNKGIELGNSDYVLLLDDDIVPGEQLLFSYAKAIEQNADAIGFAGVTFFPEPFNAVTEALYISGTTHHFSLPATLATMKWTPTANVLLKRSEFDNHWFDELLRYGGEDIALLAAKSIESGKELIAVPGAIVHHPWWNNGSVQLKRMYRYGRGAADILANPVLKRYTWLDFTNTMETILLILIATPFLIYFGVAAWSWKLIVTVLISDYFVCLLKCIKAQHKNKLAIALQLLLHKSARELGALLGSIAKGRIQDITRRLDVGFTKPHPSPYRLNRWKIFKSFLILGGILLIIAIGAAG